MNNNTFFFSHAVNVLTCAFHFLPLVCWLPLNAYNTIQNITIQNIAIQCIRIQCNNRTIQ